MIPSLYLLGFFMFGPLEPQWITIDAGYVAERHSGWSIPEAAAAEDWREIWVWSSAMAPRSLPLDEPPAFEWLPSTGRLGVRMAGGSEGEPESGWVVAAPVSLWEKVPETLLPRWPAELGSHLSIPREAGEAWRVRFHSTCCGVWWKTVAPGQSQLALTPADAETWTFTVVDGEANLLPRATLQVAEAARGAGGRRFMAQYKAIGGGLEIPSLPDLARLSVLASAEGHVPRYLEGMIGVLPETFVLERGSRVSGRFVDVEHQSIAGVHVELEVALGGGFLSMHEESGEDGRFEFSGVLPGPAVAQAVAEGFGLRRAELEVGPAGLDLGDIVLEQEAVLVVRVRDPGGRGVAGATVTPLVGPGASTDSDGRAEIRGLSPSASASFVVDAPGYRRAEENVAPPLPSSLDIEIDPVFVVLGRLVDAGGEAISGGRAFLTVGTRTQQTRLGALGEFEIEVDPERESELRLVSPMTAELRLTVEPGGAGERRDLGVLQAPRSHEVRGRLISAADGLPVADARVWTPRPGPRHLIEAWFRSDLLATASDSGGRFTLRGLPAEGAAGELRVEAHGFARRVVRLPPPGAAAGTDLGDIELDTGVDVVVRLDGASPEGAFARLDLRRRWLEIDMLKSPFVQERALFQNVPPGTSTLTILKGRELLCEDEVQIPADSESLEVSCAAVATRVSGRVTLGGYASGAGELLWLPPALETPSYIEKNRSKLGQMQAKVLGAGRPQVNVAVAAGGLFETERLIPGEWEVWWQPTGGGSSPSKKVQLPDRDHIELLLDFPVGTVIGRVVDAEERAVAKARVRELRSGQLVFSSQEGEFRLIGLEPGAIWLRAEHGDSRSAAVEVELEAGREPPPVLLVLGEEEQHEWLEILVGSRQGPVAGAFVFLETLPATGQKILTADANGRVRFRFDPPFPHSYRAAAFTREGWIFGDWRAREENGSADEMTLQAAGSGELLLTSEQSAPEIRLMAAGGWDVVPMLRRLGRFPGLAPGRPLVIDGLPEGFYDLIINEVSHQVLVRDGEVTRRVF